MRVNHIHDHYRGVNVPHSKSYIIDMSWLNKRRHYFCFFCHILLTFDLCLFFADCHPRFKEIICRELYLACSSSQWLLWRPVPVRHIFGTTLYCQVREKKILAILYFFLFFYFSAFVFLWIFFPIFCSFLRMLLSNFFTPHAAIIFCQPRPLLAISTPRPSRPFQLFPSTLLLTFFFLSFWQLFSPLIFIGSPHSHSSGFFIPMFFCKAFNLHNPLSFYFLLSQCNGWGGKRRRCPVRLSWGHRQREWPNSFWIDFICSLPKSWGQYNFFSIMAWKNLSHQQIRNKKLFLLL